MPKRKGSSSGNESATKEERKRKKHKGDKKKLKSHAEEKTQKNKSSKLNFMSSQTALQSLISPHTPKEFFKEYWEKKPLLIKREDASYYGGLFSKEDLLSILNQHKIVYEDDINVCRFVDGEKEILTQTGNATTEKIQKDFKSLKATLQFHQPQRFKDEIWELNAALEKEFGSLVGANVYITPAGSQGLAPHYDDVEVFVLQLEGKKKWSLYKPPIELPQDCSADLTDDVIGEPTHKILLEPGDLLYFPRGTVHQAYTPAEQQHSTHITISLYQSNNWGNLIKYGLTQALERAMEEDVEFRKGLPIKFLDFMGYSKSPDADDSAAETGKATDGSSVGKDVAEKQEKFKKTLAKLLTHLADYIDPHDAADSMAVDFMSGRLPPFQASDDKSDEKSEKTGQPPEDDCEVRLLHPDYLRMCLSTSYEESDDEEDDEEYEDEDEGEDESTTEEEEDIGESSEEESKKHSKKPEKKKSKEKKFEKKEKTKKKTKNEKKKKSKEQENSTESSENEESMEEDDEDDEDEYNEEEELGEEWLVLYHSVSNDRTKHMMGVPKPYGLKFPLRYKEALCHILNKASEFILVSSLPLPKADRSKMVTSLWAEGLLEVKH